MSGRYGSQIIPLVPEVPRATARHLGADSERRTSDLGEEPDAQHLPWGSCHSREAMAELTTSHCFGKSRQLGWNHLGSFENPSGQAATQRPEVSLGGKAA